MKIYKSLIKKMLQTFNIMTPGNNKNKKQKESTFDMESSLSIFYSYFVSGFVELVCLTY